MRDRRTLPAVAALVSALALTALALAGCSADAAGRSPTTASAAVDSAADRPDPAQSGAPSDTGKVAGLQNPVAEAAQPEAGRPDRIVIPAIGVDAALIDLARGADGVLAAPPADQLDKAGWYANGTIPGETGPAVIAGHVDWVDRVAVFHRLGELRPGDRITVLLHDGSAARFAVDEVRSVSKDRFPTAAVYGPTPDAQLRVITCGGPWDDARDIYSENVVVSASAVR